MWFELGLLVLFLLILLLTMLPVWQNVERSYLNQELKKHPELTIAQLRTTISDQKEEMISRASETSKNVERLNNMRER